MRAVLRALASALSRKANDMRFPAYAICALFAAAFGDAFVESAGNAGLIGTGVDTHHESLVPTVAVATILLFATAFRIAHQRLHAAREDWVVAFARRCAPVSFCNALARTVVLQLAIVAVMESYECLFGGGPPFDAFRGNAFSAFCAAAVYIACAAVVTIALRSLTSTICAACDALRARFDVPIARSCRTARCLPCGADDAELAAARLFPAQIFGVRAPPLPA